ncbi:recombinase family protein [Photobacterium swingsii]|uniref:recombinase family protein n=1 Tax=Photobacterium swingsii TaxID=680026 RepID=UPI00352F2833
MLIGYARVSTAGQSLDAQHARLKEYGCEKIYSEKVSGASKKRPELEKAIDFVRDGDILICTRLDRLARSMSNLVTLTESLSKKGVQLVVIEQNLDTTTTQGRLLFHLIGAIAEFERSLTLERTSEGREAAKNRGVQFGRKPALSEEKTEQLRADWPSAPDKSALAKQYGISRATAYRLCSTNTKGEISNE